MPRPARALSRLLAFSAPFIHRINNVCYIANPRRAVNPQIANGLSVLADVATYLAEHLKGQLQVRPIEETPSPRAK
jgi:hypothetical protein